MGIVGTSVKALIHLGLENELVLGLPHYVLSLSVEAIAGVVLHRVRTVKESEHKRCNMVCWYNFKALKSEDA